MAEDLHNDPLENFFKKNFEGFEAEPDDGVWGMIEANIPPKPSVGWWQVVKKMLLPLGIALCLGAIIVAVWQYRNARILVQQLKLKNEEVINLEEQLIKEREAAKTANEKNVPEAIPGASVPRQTHPVPVDDTQTQASDDEARSGSYLKPNPGTRDFQIITQEDEAIALGDVSSDSSVHLSANVNAGPLAALPVSGPAFLVFRDTAETFPEWQASQKRKGPAFYYGAFGEALWTNQNLAYRSQLNTDPGKTAQLSWATGLRAGLTFSHHLGVETGLDFRWYNFNIRDFANLTYTFENTTTNTEGQILGNYSISSLGAVALSTQVKNAVQNDGEDIQEGASFFMNYDLNYQLRYYTLPLFMTYTMGKKRVKTQLRAGILLHSTLGEGLNENLVAFSFNRLSPSTLELEVTALKKNFLEMNLGVNVQYEWTPQLHIGIGTNVYHTLTPMISKRHQSLGINLNFNYTFNSK